DVFGGRTDHHSIRRHSVGCVSGWLCHIPLELCARAAHFSHRRLRAHRRAAIAPRPSHRSPHPVWDRTRSMTARTCAQARRRAAPGATVFVVSLIPLGRRSVGPREQELFRAVNGLPDRLYIPAWLVMQLGTVGAAPTAAAVAWMRGDRRLAARLFAAGVMTWG